MLANAPLINTLSRLLGKYLHPTCKQQTLCASEERAANISASYLQMTACNETQGQLIMLSWSNYLLLNADNLNRTIRWDSLKSVQWKREIFKPWSQQVRGWSPEWSMLSSPCLFLFRPTQSESLKSIPEPVKLKQTHSHMQALYSF